MSQLSETYFIVGSVFTLLCGFGVVAAPNPVYCAFSLILSFFGLAGLFALWGSPFLAAVQVLIYAGAIVVLFVFVVMLLDLGRGSGPAWQNAVMFVLAGMVSAALGTILLQALGQMSLPPVSATPAEAVSAVAISKLLFTKYLWPFEVLSVFMLALIIAIYALARPDGGRAEEKEA